MVISSKQVGALLKEVRACQLCAQYLPNGVRPVLQLNPSARILIAGQAPGRKVHESGVPFDDASGDRLRLWMGIDRDIFYDESQIAILPMGFCYPGTGPSGDLPPRPECAPAWREKLLAVMPNIELTLLIGQYAQDWHLGKQCKPTLTETVRAWRDYGAALLPVPHPSPRNNIWLAKNPWFGTEVLPTLEHKVKTILNL
jgi:uracil-DNA glycosylase